MDKTQILKLISKLENNPLSEAIDSQYTQDLIARLANIDEKRYDKVKELLCGNEPFNKFKYNQGIAELLVWFFLQNKKIKYEIEVNKNIDNKSDIDVVANLNDLNYNIEIKSPQYQIQEKDCIQGRLASRTFNKNEAEQIMSEVKTLLKPGIKNTKYIDIKTQMPADNKIKDCLISAQKKFSGNSLNNINILFICTTTEEMMFYLEYLTNFYGQGLLTSNSFYDLKEYDKVFAVILSNAITLNERKDIDSWDLSKAINIIIPNNFCSYINQKSFCDVLEFFPNNTKEFYTEFCEFFKKNKDFPPPLFFIEYVAKRGFNMNKNKS